MKQLLSTVISLSFLFSACNTGDKVAKISFDEESSIENEGIKLIPVINEIEEESFGLKEYKYLDEYGKIQLKFDADLSEAIEIHYTINNGKLLTSNKTEFELDFLEGNNVLMAYLVLKNGVRLSSDSTVFVRNFYVGEGLPTFDSTTTHLFHHIPGEVDSAHIMIGFYLNTPSKIDRPHIKMIIDDLPFFLPYQKAFKVVGLSKETHHIRVQLVDGKKQVVSGPFNDSGALPIKVI